jgi:hypothetical protein
MQLGKWTTQGGAANMSNLLYFKFGSVVGFTNTVAAEGTVWPGASAVKFNPPGTIYAATAAGYQSIPYWNGTDLTDGFISSNGYHTVANVKAGRGDPCKLVGLTVEQIKAGTVDNTDWRLPTDAENAAYSSPTYVDGAGWISGTTPTTGIYKGTIGTTFLPAAGDRMNTDGSTIDVGFHGHYWSSRAYNGSGGYQLFFRSNTVNTSNVAPGQLGHSVRCVPQ